MGIVNGRKKIRTLLLGLVLLLVLCEQNIVGQTPAGNSPFGAHRMAFASQTSRAETAIGK